MTRVRTEPRADWPTPEAFAAGAAVTLGDWPFPARVLLSKALLRREAGMRESALAEYRQAVQVATSTQETNR